jgi:DNA-binding MarR family transcriptional regulator
MDALELIQLGRQLTRIGEEAMRGSRRQALPNGPSLVLRDVFAHPDSSISQIVERTGLPQSYVSESVASLTKEGMLETRPDPDDKRRKLVRMSPDHRRTVARKAAAPIDRTLAGALGDRAGDLEEVAGLLERLFGALVPAASGPVLEQIRPAAREPGGRDA